MPSRDASANFKSWLGPLLLLAVLQFGAPFVPIPSVPVAIAGIIVLTLLYVAGVVGFALGVARQQWSLPVLVAGFVGCGLAYGVTQYLARSFSLTYALQNFALLGLGTFFGILISRMIRHANMIGPIGVMVALIDIWGVLFGGIVSQLLTNKSTQGIAGHVMGHGPRLGAASSKFHLALPDIGIGDYLFLALFLGAIVHFGMNWRASAIWMWAGVSVALLAIVLLPFVPALPGLLFLGAGAVLPNLKYFQFTREEKFALLYAGIFVVVLTIGLYIGFTSMLPKDQMPARETQRAQRK
ncbi:hypothetical protein IAD21_01289 [Abditibacteriota bacterium]|nr:hypothetical protein IAD21_01289 [Abditibacteriota bacterium]